MSALPNRLRRMMPQHVTADDLDEWAAHIELLEDAMKVTDRELMADEEIVKLAGSLGLIHYYDSEGHWSGVTNENLIEVEANRNDKRLVEILRPFYEAIVYRIKEQNAPEITRINEYIKQQCSDPALDFCHRFAVLMECMILSDKPHNCWDEANSLLEQYHLALEDWREANGEPYVSGFGKD